MPFDKNYYQELWLQDPSQAETYRLSTNATEHEQNLYNEVNIQRQIREIALWHDRHPEFPGGDEAAGVIMKRLNAEGKGISVENLDSAYSACIRAGELSADPESQRQMGEQKYYDMPIEDLEKEMQQRYAAGERVEPGGLVKTPARRW